MLIVSAPFLCCGAARRGGSGAVPDPRARPEVVVVVTDGDTPWPDRAPAGTRVVVALTRAGGSAPAWARAVVVETETGT